MKAIKILKRSLLGLAAMPVILFAGGGTALAAQIPYVPGQPLPVTPAPVFNIFSNIPFGVGDESDFVRVRPGNGDSTDSGTNGDRNALYTDTLSAACNTGDLYDVRTYVHNGADPESNDNGTGTGIAKGVKLAMTVKLGVTDDSFPFTSTLTSTNTASVTDTGTLNCGRNVRLELVPTSVKAFTSTLGWTDVSVNAVNGQINIGSHVMNSGDVWGCWDERIQIVYTVKVVEIPTPPPAPIYSCDLLTNTGKISDKRYGFKVTFTAKNGATLKDVTYVYSDGTTDTDGDTTAHTFSDTNPTKKVTATANFTVNGQVKADTDAKCKVEFTVPAPQAVLAATTTTPRAMPATGAGSVIGIFAGTSVLGAFLYRLRALRINR